MNLFAASSQQRGIHWVSDHEVQSHHVSPLITHSPPHMCWIHQLAGFLCGRTVYGLLCEWCSHMDPLTSKQISMCSSWTLRNLCITSRESWIMWTSESLQWYGNPKSTLNRTPKVGEWKCAWSNYHTEQCRCASVLRNTERREKACLAALVWIWQQQWICDRGITINLFL